MSIVIRAESSRVISKGYYFYLCGGASDSGAVTTAAPCGPAYHSNYGHDHSTVFANHLDTSHGPSTQSRVALLFRIIEIR